MCNAHTSLLVCTVHTIHIGVVGALGIGFLLKGSIRVAMRGIMRV